MLRGKREMRQVTAGYLCRLESRKRGPIIDLMAELRLSETSETLFVWFGPGLEERAA